MRVSRVEQTGPLWRLVAVVAAFGSLGALGYYLNIAAHLTDFATLFVITTAVTVSLWARLHPELLLGRFGPFGRIATAVAASHDDLRAWVRGRTLLTGVLAGLGYGLLVIAGKHVVVAAARVLWSPWLAASAGLAVGAVVVAPEVFTTLGRRLRHRRR